VPDHERMPNENRRPDDIPTNPRMRIPEDVLQNKEKAEGSRETVGDEGGGHLGPQRKPR